LRTRPDVTTRISLEDGAVTIDEAGYLVDPEEWSEAFARHVAEEEGFELGPLHWSVIAFMRGYLDEHGIAADARFALKFLAEQRETDKSGARKLMFELFPYGYVKQACRIAGMRQPRAWSTG